eukprot:GEMP01075929.1.p1 GENE.GEMP01075929.1~~GEMP01075929.1.p1  ORF type:complete len:212 (+),score=37.87 GEMP01075929.1:92-727(+)
MVPSIKITQMCDPVALLGTGEYVEEMLAMSQKYAWELHALDSSRFPSDIWQKLNHVEYLVVPVTGRGYTSRVSYQDILRLKSALDETKNIYHELKASLDSASTDSGGNNWLESVWPEMRPGARKHMRAFDVTEQDKQLAKFKSLQLGFPAKSSKGAGGDLALLSRQYAAFGPRKKWFPILRTFDRLGVSVKALLHEAKYCQVGSFPQKAFL